MEIEIKLAPALCCTWDAIQKNEEFFLSPSRTFEMAASYFDTPDRALKRGGISLRLRQENGISVCCLKSRVSQNARQEFGALEPMDASALTAEQTDALYTQGKLWKKQTGSIAEYRKSRGY